MTPEPLPPIPCPPQHYWRQFRINALPVVICFGVLLLTLWLWGRNLANPLVMGQAEAQESEVTSPIDGRIAKLNVSLYQNVQAGDVIAIIEAAQPQILSNTVALARAEMEAIRVNAGLEPADRIRLADFQLTWMIRRAELITAKTQLTWAETEYKRVAALAKEGYVGTLDVDTAKRDVEQARLTMEEHDAAIKAAEKAWGEMNPASVETGSPALQSALAVAQENLRLAESQLEPIVLTAPISGCVRSLDKLAGASVVGGDPIVTIANPTASWIVGYLSQPVRIEPSVGMKAEVRTRGIQRTIGEAQITMVGPRIELFDAPLRVRGMGSAQQRGLPIMMNIPPNLRVRPGEIVDVRLIVN